MTATRKAHTMLHLLFPIVIFCPKALSAGELTQDASISFRIDVKISVANDSNKAVLVHHAVVSPDGTLIGAACYDNRIRLFDAQTGKPARSIIVPTPKKTFFTSPLLFISFSPDGKMIVTAHIDGAARVWSTETGQLLQTMEGHTDRVNTAVFSPDGSKIVTASGFVYQSDSTARVWDVKTGKNILKLEHPLGVRCAYFSPDANRIVTGGQDCVVRIWNAVSGEVVQQAINGAGGSVQDVKYSRDGTRIVAAMHDGTAKVFKIDKLEAIRTLTGHTKGVYHASFSANGRNIVTASGDNTVRIWDVESGRTLAVLKGHKNIVHSASFMSEDSRIFTASLDGTMIIWKRERPEDNAKTPEMQRGERQ